MSPQYLAGLVDGEGYLGLIPCKKATSKNITYQCVLKLCLAGMNAEKVITMIGETYAGHVYKRNKNTATGKEVYTVEIKSRPRMKVLLDDIEPYMIVKKEQVVLMREYLELPMLHPNHFSFSQELFDRRLEIARSLKALTQRTPLAETN
jgi:hypothetical protein